eukprot:gnl/Spiro4/6018_TR3085_c0_g1_i1.p1 gnl/Spiro4/6018_TR3085_c0_g1~~gnl/Spiro4/6018_TR3085_c0_g1_i1.p1  ORF type:complete len:157 (+),score=25.70 gnl/Spiro4/6018_TR3085_c0_g1_i1:28-471(+)
MNNERTLRAAFESHANADGLLPLENFCDVVKTLGAPHTAIDELLDDVETDEAGNIDFESFLKVAVTHFMRSSRSSTPAVDKSRQQKILDAFRVFDRHGHGFVNSSLLSRSLCEFLDSAQLERFMIDAQEVSGRIHYRPFVHLITANS